MTDLDYLKEKRKQLKEELTRRGIISYSWVTKTGKLIHMKDMSDEHLTNAYNMVNRRIEELTKAEAEEDYYNDIIQDCLGDDWQG